MYYYIQSEKQEFWTDKDGNEQVSGPLWTVGCEHNGKWLPESDHDSKESAAERVHYLNGGR